MAGAEKDGLLEVVMIVGVHAIFLYVTMAGCEVEVEVEWRRGGGVWVEADVGMVKVQRN